MISGCASILLQNKFTELLHFRFKILCSLSMGSVLCDLVKDLNKNLAEFTPTDLNVCVIALIIWTIKPINLNSILVYGCLPIQYRA
jgi:uncharacterized membrane-anchored protein